jgi:drug/metabolite transporter (DMT)-like permease
VLPIALGLSAAACVGVGDFVAGVASRRLAPALVGFWAQGTAVVLGAVLLLLVRPGVVSGQVPWGLAAGLATGAGLALMYRARASGAVSLVAPITACSVVFPVIYAVVTGETLTPLAAAGIVAVIVGVVLASLRPVPAIDASTHGDGGENRQAIFLAIAAAVAFGAFFIMIDLAPQAGNWGVLWTAGPARLSSFAVQAGLVLLGPRRLASPRPFTPHVMAAGALDQLSLVLLGLGAMTDAYGIVTVLMGLYPVVTALLGMLLLKERLTPVQSTGAVLAMAGVLLVSV